MMVPCEVRHGHNGPVESVPGRQWQASGFAVYILTTMSVDANQWVVYTV